MLHSIASVVAHKVAAIEAADVVVAVERSDDVYWQNLNSIPAMRTEE